MSCERRRRSPLLALLALLSLIAACGKKGPPRPPPRLIPAAAEDLVVEQHGGRLVLSMSYPVTTTSGLPLPGIEALEVWRASLPVTSDEATPAAQLDRQTFAAVAELATVLEDASLSEATRGERLITELALQREMDEPVLLVMAARTRSLQGLPSPFSNLVSLRLRRPPPPPAMVETEATAGGVLVSWQYEETAAIGGFDVLRRPLQAERFGSPSGRVGAEARSFLDESAVFGESYAYTVRAVASRDGVVASRNGPVSTITPTDSFPPDAPRGLVALPEEARVRLLWRPVDASDLAGYRVYRREEGGSLQPLDGEPLPQTETVDESVRPGLTFTYRVTAVDEAGNESQPSEEVTVNPR